MPLPIAADHLARPLPRQQFGLSLALYLFLCFPRPLFLPTFFSFTSESDSVLRDHDEKASEAEVARAKIINKVSVSFFFVCFFLVVQLSCRK